MFNAIDEIKRQYIYTVQPVQLFETKNTQAAQKNPFDYLNQTNKSSNYNLLHPDVSNSAKGNHLDLMG